jgi:tetratricopeptide (TPR) repeat protein
MSYWSYYLVWTLAAYALRQPWLLAGIVLFLFLRRIIPDPGALFRALSRSGALRAQVEVNPANATARRDLAQIYLDVRRPRAALALVEQALARTPNEPELLYLAGLAQHRAGRQAEALPNLVRAVELDPRIRFGQPYLVAGDALFALGRHEESVDAYERYLETNSSDIHAYVRLAKAHAQLGDMNAARAAMAEARNTWRVLPYRMKRRGFLRGFFALLWARVTVLKELGAIAVALIVVIALAAAGVYAYRAVQEFCLTRTLERTADRLRAEAVWHEDVNDPGDASLVELRLTRQGEKVRVAITEPGGGNETEVAVVKKRD